MCSNTNSFRTFRSSSFRLYISNIRSFSSRSASWSFCTASGNTHRQHTQSWPHCLPASLPLSLVRYLHLSASLSLSPSLPLSLVRSLFMSPTVSLCLTTAKHVLLHYTCTYSHRTYSVHPLRQTSLVSPHICKHCCSSEIPTAHAMLPSDYMTAALEACCIYTRTGPNSMSASIASASLSHSTSKSPRSGMQP